MLISQVNFRILPDPARSLPEGALSFQLASVDDARQIQAAHLAIDPSIPATGPVTCVEFDDGRVVAELDGERLVGLEVLAPTAGPANLPELMLTIVNHNDELLWSAIVTTMQLWLELQSQVTMEDGINRIGREWLSGVWRLSSIGDTDRAVTQLDGDGELVAPGQQAALPPIPQAAREVPSWSGA